MNTSKLIQALRQRFNPERGDFKIFIVTLSIIVAVFACGIIFNIMPAITAVLLAILFVATWIFAGVAVFRSLIAASVCFSLVLFIAQSYCDLPSDLHVADESLMSLFAFGLMYAGALFLSSLWKELFGDKSKKKKGSVSILKEIYGGKAPWTILILYAASLGLFLLQLVQVISPIVYGLCVY